MLLLLRVAEKFRAIIQCIADCVKSTPDVHETFIPPSKFHNGASPSLLAVNAVSSLRKISCVLEATYGMEKSKDFSRSGVMPAWLDYTQRAALPPSGLAG